MTPGGEGTAVIRALIASRVRVYREALAEVLSRSPRLRVLGTASHVDEILEQLKKDPVDVVLIDSTFPEVPASVREIRRHAGDVKVVAVTIPSTEEDVMRLAEAGVAGYVLPDGSID